MREAANIEESHLPLGRKLSSLGLLRCSLLLNLLLLPQLVRSHLRGPDSFFGISEPPCVISAAQTLTLR